MAANLARSFRRWHTGSGIRFVLVTDNPGEVPSDLHDFVEVEAIEPEKYGKGFSPKLHLDRLAPAERTLFVDADCLITAPLDSVFERFEGRDVSTVGQMISDGEWWGDVAERCEKMGVDEVPLFVGCVYYLERGKTASEVYATARSLEERYDELGLIPLRGMPNEEPLVSLAMALHEQTPVENDGTIKADAMSYPSGIDVDVFQGRAVFKDDTHGETLTDNFSEARPVIAHFNDTYVQGLPYLREAARLEKVQGRGWPLWTADAYSRLRYEIPYSVVKETKDRLRPLYRALFGTRGTKKNIRE